MDGNKEIIIKPSQFSFCDPGLDSVLDSKSAVWTTGKIGKQIMVE